MELNSPEASGYVALIVLIAVVLGIIAKPAIALVILGIVALIGGLISLASGNIFGISFGTTGVVSGVGLVGFGRLIAYVESLLAEIRLLRQDMAIREPGTTAPPLAASLQDPAFDIDMRQERRK